MRLYVQTARVDLGDPNREGKLLGGGGAGNVYAHPALVQGTCLKIYHRDRAKDYAAEHAAKVAAMVRNRPDLVFTADGATVQMAWPLDNVVDERGKFAGFVMPVIDFAHSWGGAQVIHPLKRMRGQIPLGQRLGLIVALNVANLLQSLHASGHAVIDLKPDNLRVYDQSRPERAGFVSLLDCDGFAISDNASGLFHPAGMATAEYAHPAWFDKSRGIDWLNAHGRDQDMFAAGVMFFQLLNGNIHPMAGSPVGAFAPPSSNPEKLAQSARFYAYGVRPNPNMRPDQDSLHPWMDRELRDLFDRTFLDVTPPGPPEWIRVLKRLNDPARACPVDPNHWRIGDECPQCALERQRPQPSPTATPAPPTGSQTALGATGAGSIPPAVAKAAAPVIRNPNPTTVANLGFQQQPANIKANLGNRAAGTASVRSAIVGFLLQIARLASVPVLLISFFLNLSIICMMIRNQIQQEMESPDVGFEILFYFVLVLVFHILSIPATIYFSILKASSPSLVQAGFLLRDNAGLSPHLFFWLAICVACVALLGAAWYLKK